jgi:hypothetical protein
MYAGGMSYVSECSLGFMGRLSPGAATIVAIERRRSERILPGVVENFIGWKWMKH